jgi:hypothetical protein
MQLNEVIWKDYFVDKIEVKHGILTDEVEEVLFGKPHVRRTQKGHVKVENLYTAYGQTLESDEARVPNFAARRTRLTLLVCVKAIKKAAKNLIPALFQVKLSFKVRSNNELSVIEFILLVILFGDKIKR